MNTFKQILVAASLLGLTSAAFAVPIVGTINIGGASTVLNDGTNSTGIDFGAASVNFAPLPTGDFAGLESINTSGSTGDTLTMTDFLYAQIPEMTIWSIDLGNDGTSDFSFTLTSVAISSGDTADFSNLVLNGTGYFLASDTGLDKTYGSWTFSQSGASFSSESVPEPAIALLLATGLIGFGAARKMRKAA